MYREKIKELYQWKEQKNKSILLINGAKQVGKTWLVQEFAKNSYKNIVSIKFKSDKKYAKEIIEYTINDELPLQVSNIVQIIDRLEKVESQETIIIFDEIVDARMVELINKMQTDRKWDIIIISSKVTEIDLGKKVKVLRLYPLNFIEFLYAIGEKSLAKDLEEANIENLEKNQLKYINNIKKYIYIGGMPAVVKEFVENKDYREVREKQKAIVKDYEQEMEKEGKVVGDNLKSVWRIVINQIRKKQKEFDYREIKKGARASEYEMIIKKLEDYGYIYKVNRILKPEMPMVAFQDVTKFRLFPVDIGLLSAMIDYDLKLIIEENTIFNLENQTLIMQFIMQELINKVEVPIYYWKDENINYEIDFIIQYQAKIYPLKINLIERKIEKSLKWFHQKYENYSGIQLNYNTYKWNGWYTDIPIYLIGSIKEVIKRKERK